MKERGQIFTLDMFFALTLTVLVVSYSGLALEQARRQAEGYALRYSLERVVNDAADVLVKTAGIPSNWEENVENLGTLGLASAQNSLSIRKFENLRHLCASENWKGLAKQAVMDFFDNSENFEIRLIDETTGENLWPPIYPRWDVKTTSGGENSLEVVVVKRLVDIGEVDIREEIKGMLHITGEPPQYYLEFTVGSNELNTRDWYIVVAPADPGNPTVWIWINREIPPKIEDNYDYHFPESKPPIFRPRWHGLDDNDPNHPDPYPKPKNPKNFVVLHEGTNYLWVRVSGGEEYPANLFITALPRCSPSSWAWLPDFGTLEVKLWR